MINADSLFKKYSKKIYNLAYRMTGNIDAANDITQETFIQAFDNINKFRSESHVYTWLYSIAKNNCLKFLKSKKRSSFLEISELIENKSSPVCNEFSEEEKSNLIAQVKDGCLSGLLRCLSLQQRLAFILNVLLDLPISQVAVVIDCSENAVRILVHRAKQNLKEFLCRNCSLYDSKNKCRCENLINFSLKQKWIKSGTQNIETAEQEIKELKDVTSLYKTISERIPTQDICPEIKQILFQKKNFLILNNKKVK